MATLREIHRFMNLRLTVVLDDGRIGKIMRVDTHFPEETTTVSLWTNDERSPGLAKVDISHVVGSVPVNHPSEE